MPDADAAVLYTSVRPARLRAWCTQRQLAGMRDAIANTYGFAPGSGLVAGFAPFALLGPALGCYQRDSYDGCDPPEDSDGFCTGVGCGGY